MSTKARRTSEEVAVLAAKAHELISDGMQIQDAVKKVGLYESVYRRWAKSNVTGRMDISQLPPRPVKGRGGKRTPRVVDEKSVESLAHRISVLDRKLAGVVELQKERKRLAQILLKLLGGTE